MEHTGPQLISTSELAPVHRSGTTPFSQQTVVLTKQAYIELKWEANYWRAQHERLLEREAALQAEVKIPAASCGAFRNGHQTNSTARSKGFSGTGYTGE